MPRPARSSVQPKTMTRSLSRSFREEISLGLSWSITGEMIVLCPMLLHHRSFALRRVFQLGGDFVSQHARFHPANRQQIAEGFEEVIPHAVFAFAVDTGIIADRDLHYRKPFHLQKSRDEAMQAA